MAQQLNINSQQFSLLDEFAEKTADTEVQANLATMPQENLEQPGFLSSLGLGGLGNKLQNSGINVGSLTKGLLAVAGPMILSSLLNRRGRGGGGGLNPFGMGSGGGGLGGLAGGLGGLLGGLGGLRRM